MYRRILVPLDGSDVAEQVLPYVRLLGKGFGASVELFGVFAPVRPCAWDPECALTVPGIVATVRRHTQDYLERVAASLRSDGLTVSATVREGGAAESITEAAAAEPATLLVLCTHGRSGTTIRALGSTADRVLHATAQPAFVVPSRHLNVLGPTVRLGVMLVPLDGSRLTEEVLPHVVALAKAVHSSVMLVGVVPAAEERARDTADPARGRPAPAPSVSEAWDTRARTYLESVRAQLVRQGVSAVEACVLQGPPADRTVQLACGITDCFFALTTSGPGEASGGLPGHVADRLVRHAVAPVLVVRAMTLVPERMSSCSLLQESEVPA